MWNWQILPQLALTNAVRYDHLILRYSGDLVAGSQFTTADYNGARLGEFSFNSGVVYKPTEEDSFRLLIARGVQAPSLSDFGTQVSGLSGAQQVSFVGNPTLDAATVTNYEVDYDRTLALMGAILRAAVYYQRTDDLLATALVLPTSPGAGGLVSYAQNVGNSRAVGGEIGLKGKTDSGIRWSASYSLISITDDLTLGALSGSSQLLDYEHGAPASVVDIGAGYSWDRFELDGQARWQSHFTDYNPTPSGAVVPVRIDDYVTLNARLAYRLTDDVTLALAGDQLIQSRILEAAGIPVERRVMLSVTGKF
jgi:iron complex outermembrane receptor protein